MCDYMVVLLCNIGKVIYGQFVSWLNVLSSYAMTTNLQKIVITKLLAIFLKLTNILVQKPLLFLNLKQSHYSCLNQNENIALFSHSFKRFGVSCTSENRFI